MLYLQAQFLASNGLHRPVNKLNPKAPSNITSLHLRVLHVHFTIIRNPALQALRGRGQSSIKCGQGIGKQTSETTRVGIT